MLLSVHHRRSATERERERAKDGTMHVLFFCTNTYMCNKQAESSRSTSNAQKKLNYKWACVNGLIQQFSSCTKIVKSICNVCVDSNRIQTAKKKY